MNVYVYSFLNSVSYGKDLTGIKIAEQCDFNFVSSLRNVKSSRHRVLIRYGKADWRYKDRIFGKVYNKSDAIRLNCRKFSSLVNLKNNGIQIPHMSTNIRNMEYPFLRRTYYHSRGRDIKIIRNSNEVVRGDYYVELLSNYREYRVYFFGDECIRITLKVNPDRDNNHSIIKNSANGWVFKDHFNHRIGLEKKVIEVCREAFLLTGLDFGAVDVLVTFDNNDERPEGNYKDYIYVLEVNSAPRLSNFGIELLSHYFLSDLNCDIDISKFERIREDSRNELPIRFRKIYVNL